MIRPRGCTNLAAANLRGTGYVARDFVWEELSGTIANRTHVRVRARFAGLEGYLLSKCVAVRTRAAAKDYYDLVYVLLHNRAGGPEQAARRLLDGGLADALGAAAYDLSRGEVALRQDKRQRASRICRAGTRGRTGGRPRATASGRRRRRAAVRRGTRHLRGHREDGARFKLAPRA
jgi:hypothetical protein